MVSNLVEDGRVSLTHRVTDMCLIMRTFRLSIKHVSRNTVYIGRAVTEHMFKMPYTKTLSHFNNNNYVHVTHPKCKIYI